MAENIKLLRSLSGYMRIYQGKVKKYPRYADLRNILGLLYYIHGKYSFALRQFDQALSINPLYEEGTVNRCFALSAVGKRKKAIK